MPTAGIFSNFSSVKRKLPCNAQRNVEKADEWNVWIVKKQKKKIQNQQYWNVIVCLSW